MQCNTFFLFLKALIQELNECQSEISSLIQILNCINQNFSHESTNDLREKILNMRSKSNTLSEKAHEKIQKISNVLLTK